MNYYQKEYNEDNCLIRNQNNLVEYQTTIHFLSKYIPSKSTVLDFCAGGGVYAFPVAKIGHIVTAGDLVDDHVKILKEK